MNETFFSRSRIPLLNLIKIMNIHESPRKRFVFVKSTRAEKTEEEVLRPLEWISLFTNEALYFITTCKEDWLRVKESMEKSFSLQRAESERFNTKFDTIEKMSFNQLMCDI